MSRISKFRSYTFVIIDKDLNLMLYKRIPSNIILSVYIKPILKRNMQIFIISKGFFRHNIVEILSWNFPAIAGSSLEHLFKLLHIHCFSQLFGYSLDIIYIDASCLIIIKEIEYLIYSALYRLKNTLDSLSPSFEVIASRNYSKSIYLASLSS